ncbi:MAG: alpha/beta hydrolase [Bacteroidales bacterium]|nr:alpha/beta hydrolase [Bacteroidales bacterium]
MKTKFLMLVATVLIAGSLMAQERIYLWEEGKMPNSRLLEMKDSIANERVYQVARPWIEYFAAPADKNTGAAVVIVPGGGYARLAYVVSGTDLAKWFNENGIHAFVLYHRLPISPDLYQREMAPLQDAQRALRLIRSRAQEWHIDITKVGAMGSSAGAHLVSTVGTHDEDVSSLTDDLDEFSYRPDFMIMVSPVISLEDASITHKGSRDNLLGKDADDDLLKAYSNDHRVDASTPPAIMFHADNDRAVSCMNSIRFYSAMKANKRPASLHIFPQGGHSISLEPQPGTTQYWSPLAIDWLKEMQIIK